MRLNIPADTLSTPHTGSTRSVAKEGDLLDDLPPEARARLEAVMARQLRGNHRCVAPIEIEAHPLLDRVTATDDLDLAEGSL